MNLIVGDLSEYNPRNWSDFFLVIKSSFKAGCRYLLDKNTKKFKYLFINLVTAPSEFLRMKASIEIVRHTHKTCVPKKMSADSLKLGHPVGWENDTVFWKRVHLLQMIPPGELTQASFDSVCKSDAPPEVFKGVLLNGNGRVGALMYSGHGDFELTVLVRGEAK